MCHTCVPRALYLLKLCPQHGVGVLEPGVRSPAQWDGRGAVMAPITRAHRHLTGRSIKTSLRAVKIARGWGEPRMQQSPLQEEAPKPEAGSPSPTCPPAPPPGRNPPEAHTLRGPRQLLPPLTFPAWQHGAPISMTPSAVSASGVNTCGCMHHESSPLGVHPHASTRSCPPVPQCEPQKTA